MRKSTLNQIQCNNTVFAARKSNIKHIHLFLVLNKSVIYFLNCVLRQLFDNIPVLLNHRRDIDKPERKAVRLWIFNQHNLGRSIARTTFHLCDQSTAIKVVICFRPHIRETVVFVIFPMLVEAKYIKFFIVHGTWLFREGERGRRQNISAC